MTTYNAYHFVGKTLQDGSPVPPDGETLRWTGDLVMCQSGLHASRKPWQALEHAPGHTLCRVHCAGELIQDFNKLVCRERTIVSRVDTSALLWAFARKCALDVTHLWECTPVMLEYLNTGDETKRDAARDAARTAAFMAQMLICNDLKIPRKHRSHAKARWRVWEKGYGLACDVGGVLYVYALDQGR